MNRDQQFQDHLSHNDHQKSGWRPLWALFLLGFMGGIIFDAGDVLIRLWSKDMDLLPKQLDWLNGIEIIHPLKFLWAPLLSIPLAMQGWRGRRSWLILIMGVMGISTMVLPSLPFWGWWFLGILLIFTMARASYDALIIASQMDVVSKSLWGWSENCCVTGYRIGIMLTSYGALSASSWGLSWPRIYLCVSVILVASTLFLARHPLFHFLNTTQSASQLSPKTFRFWSPIQDWLRLRGSVVILIFLTIYRLQDGMLDPQREYFLLDSGVTKIQLAHLKSLGLCGSIAGGFTAGACIRYVGYRNALTWGLILHGCAGGLLYVSSLYPGLSWGPLSFLNMAYCLEQTTKGWSTISIYSFQLLCCQGQNVLTQLALFSALSDLGLKIISARSGWFAQEYGWSALMAFGSLCGLPALSLIPYVFSRTWIKDQLSSSYKKL